MSTLTSMAPTMRTNPPRRPKQLLITIYQLLLFCLATLACSLLPPGAGPRPTATALALPPTSEPQRPTGTDDAPGFNTPVAEPEIAAPENLSIGDPYAPELGNGGYDVQHYTLRVALRPGETHLDATAQIELESTQARLTQVSLDFVGFDIDSVTVDEIPADFQRLDAKLLVDLPQALPDGVPATIEVVYQGAPVQEPSVYVPFVTHLGLHFQPDHIYVVSEPDGARYWFPANDHPRDKATFRFEIVTPPGQVGVANGELVTTQHNVADAFPSGGAGDLHIWEHNFPMAPYQATVAVGPYVRVEDTSPGGVVLRHYMLESDLADFEPYRPRIGEMMDWMEEQFGPYPFEAFGYVLVDDLGGALETQTMVVTDRQGVSDNLLAHELAHMWFGDWVSLESWGEMWRSEGFATYLAALWPNRDQADRFAEQLAPAIAQGPQNFPLRNPSPSQLFSGPIYEDGALLIGELRANMDDEDFYAGLRAYFQRYCGGTASDAEFQDVMEEAAGEPLDAIFEKWLE